MRQHALAAVLTAVSMLVACSGDDDAAAPPEQTASDVADGEAFPDDRCEANRAAGTITYLTGFDFAAAASILEVVVADERGYFEELCLDVEVRAGGSTENYPLVAADDAQFSSSGSFTELATFSERNEADLVALSVDGHVAIDVLMIKPDVASSLDELAGKQLGILFALPPAVAVMLQQEADLVEGDDFSTVLLDGFDPVAHMAIDDIAGRPGWRSNEPGALARAGVAFDVYDPSDYDIPGSFGLVYTNRAFLTDHPTAAEDFMRATLRALQESIADPAAAAAIAVDRINGNGNPRFLSPEGETFRWETDAETITRTTPEGSNVGVPAGAELEAQIAAYDAVGFFGDEGAPAVEGRYDPDLAAGLYADDDSIIWPA